MALLAGQILTVGMLDALQTRTYRAVASASLSGPATDADVPGASVSFTTLRPNAIAVAVCVWDYDLNAGTTATGSGRLSVDSALQAEYAVFGAQVATDRSTVTQVYRVTLASAGSHTLKLVASPAASQIVNVYSTLTVAVHETL